MHFNISSIEYHIEEFQIILQLLNNAFDFICISETKIRKKSEPKTDIKIKGYNPPIGDANICLQRRCTYICKR